MKCVQILFKEENENHQRTTNYYNHMNIELIHIPYNFKNVNVTGFLSCQALNQDIKAYY